MGLVPKGIQLERKYNPLLADSHPLSTRAKIGRILLKADWEIHKTTVNDYSELIITINNKLEAVEDKLKGLEQDPNSSMAIHQTIHHQHALMERQEHNLRRALQRTRQRKAEYNTGVGGEKEPRGKRGLHSHG